MDHSQVAELIKEKVGRGTVQHSSWNTKVVDWSTSNKELWTKTWEILEGLGYEHVKPEYGADNPYTMQHPNGSKAVVGFDRSSGTTITIFPAKE